jgi:hypothetical protein
MSVLVKSVLPKLRPVTVRDNPADAAELSRKYDTTGAERYRQVRSKNEKEKSRACRL